MSPATLTRPHSTALLERDFSHTPNLKVDRQAGIIRQVKVLGKHSLNNRDYSDAAMHEAAELYRKRTVPVYLDHPLDRNSTRDRSSRDLVGWIQNVSEKSDGVYADLHLYKSHNTYEQTMERAERNPEGIGMSHSADGHTVRQGGRTVVETVTVVHSVDIVTNPATSRNLFESHSGEEQMHYPSTHASYLRSISDRGGYRPRQKLQHRLREANDFAPTDTGGGEDLESLLVRAFNSAESL